MVAIATATGHRFWMPEVQLAEKYPSFSMRRSGFIRTKRDLPTITAYSTMEELARHPKVIAWGEDWPRLLLRSFAARHAEEGLLAADGVGCAAKLPIVIHFRPFRRSDNAWRIALA